jgi:uncharacterized protein (TIGR02246 family)
MPIRISSGGAVAAMLAIASTGNAAPANHPQIQAIRVFLRTYLSAWSHSDARTISAQFTDDGDFISPQGILARGRARIAAFYGTAFKSGYAGSLATFDLARVRVIRPGIFFVDGSWTITNARNIDGRPRAPERGIASAVIVREAGAWRVAALREQSSATVISAFAPYSRASHSPSSRERAEKASRQF